MPRGSSAASKKTSKKESKKERSYQYTGLGEVPTSADANQKFHIYGTIIDSSFPYKTSTGKFICTMKISDPSLQKKGAKGTTDGGFAQLVFYAKRFADLPIAHRIGDIVRVHRATMRLYKNTRQFNACVFYNASWALFSTPNKSVLEEIGAEEAVKAYHPFAFLGKNPTLEKVDQKQLDTLRDFSRKLFRDGDVISKDMYVPLAQASKQKGDFDVLAKIQQIHEKDEYSNELRVRDVSGQTWFVTALKQKFPHLRHNNIIRIRGCSVDETAKKNFLILGPYSNIMTFIPGAHVASTQSQKISDDQSTDAALLKEDGAICSPVYYTQVAKKYQGNDRMSTFHEIFHEVDTSKVLQDQTEFRVCFWIVRFEQEVRDFVRANNKGKWSSLKGQKGNGQWHFSFLAKDASTQYNNNLYRLCVSGDEGFFGKPANLWTDDKARKRTEDHVKNLLRFNVWCDAIVARCGGNYCIKETKIAF